MESSSNSVRPTRLRMPSQPSNLPDSPNTAHCSHLLLHRRSISNPALHKALTSTRPHPPPESPSQ
ncbi:hypothetical protein AOQ84DRAFT_356925, partial [Glonium stellatum]